VHRAFGVLHTWQQVLQIDGVQMLLTRPIIITYGNQPPPPGYVKCNIDVAIFVDGQQVGMSAYLRNAT